MTDGPPPSDTEQDGDSCCPKGRPRGRPRSESARAAILNAALAILEAEGYARVTMEGIAAKAGVGKQTLYRWWPSKAAVVMEAYASAVERRVPMPETGDFATDLRAYVLRTFAAAEEACPIICSLMAESQIDPDFAQEFRQGFIAQRRRKLAALLEQGVGMGALAPSLDLDLLMDLVYGPMWYRLLNRHAPLDEGFAHALVDFILGGGRPSSASG